MALGIYLHFPYCLSKCPYCDFASQVESRIPQQRYADAVRRELALRQGELKGRRAVSLYIGGGTPSLWAPEQLHEVLSAIRSAVPFEDNAELTLEANPGASDAGRFAAYRQMGFNRLSIGFQSLEDRTLAALGRRHSAAEALAALEAARKAGFENLTADLIYGAPGQSLEAAREDARRAAALSVEHLSCYALTLEHLAVEVPMAKSVREGRLQVPDDEAQWEMGRAVAAELTAKGYERYEISNFARPGFRARHNSLYWQGGEYLGLGAGACGFMLADPARPALGGRRWGNHRGADRYYALIEEGRRPEDWSEDLTAADLLHERLAMGLRMLEGVDLARVCEELEQDREPILDQALKLCERGLASREGSRLKLTERGLDFHTEAALYFV